MSTALLSLPPSWGEPASVVGLLKSCLLSESCAPLNPLFVLDLSLQRLQSNYRRAKEPAPRARFCCFVHRWTTRPSANTTRLWDADRTHFITLPPPDSLPRAAARRCS